MFRFIKEHSYEIVKLFFTQIGIAVFGLVLSFATNSNSTLFLISSIFSAIFYNCLLYSEGWELGAKDRPRITNGRMKYTPAKGVYFSLLSNSVNYVFVLIMLVCLLFGSALELFGNIYVITWRYVHGYQHVFFTKSGHRRGNVYRSRFYLPAFVLSFCYDPLRFVGRTWILYGCKR